MKTSGTVQLKTHRRISGLTRNNACQRCQDKNEYLMIFTLPFNRNLWVCSSCYFELSRAQQTG